jgi:hypothetical protein
MASFYAELEIEGQTYPVRWCRFGFEQATHERGRVRGKVRHGLLHLTLDVPDGDQLLTWANTPTKALAGHITFFETSQLTARETVGFATGYCVGYDETFASGDGTSGAYLCRLTISADKLELTPGGPTRALGVAAVRDYVTAASALVSAPAVAGKSTAWLDDLEAVLGPAADVRTMVARWVTGGLDEGKLQSALHGAADKQQMFERLCDAADPAKKGRGIYQQRVVIDDFANIPGVELKKYVNNGLPPVAIPASNFGVNDPDLDLPEGNAPTFADYAKLVEIKPGEKLYRVTNDPISEPYAKTGGYWTRTPPTQLAEVIGGTAVMPEWNNFQRVYEFTAPPYADPINKEPKFHAWEGPAATQPVSNIYKEKKDSDCCLTGGANQLFVPNKLSRNPDFGNHIQDVTSQHKSW